MRVVHLISFLLVFAMLTTALADQYYKTLRWLSTIDFEANHVNACRLQQSGTGLWLIEGEYFSEWAEKDNSTFWLHAIRKLRIF